MENSHVVYKPDVHSVYNINVFRRWSRTIREYMFYPPQYTPRAKEKGSGNCPVLFLLFFYFSAYSPLFMVKIDAEVS